MARISAINELGDEVDFTLTILCKTWLRNSAGNAIFKTKYTTIIKCNIGDNNNNNNINSNTNLSVVLAADSVTTAAGLFYFIISERLDCEFDRFFFF